MQIDIEAWHEMNLLVHGLTESCPINVDNVDDDIIMFSMSPHDLLVLADMCDYALKAHTLTSELKERVSVLRFRGVPLNREEYSRAGDRRHDQ